MKYIYVILLLLVLFVLIYSITEDRCNVEKFTQIDDPKYVYNMMLRQIIHLQVMYLIN